MNALIIAEANFIQQLIYELYIGREEFTVVNFRSINSRLQSIRDEARKERDENEKRPHS